MPIRLNKKESFYVRKGFNSHKSGLEYQPGHRFALFWNTDMEKL